MIVAEKLGISPDDVDVLHSDTAIAPLGMDTYGSRSLPVGGVAIAMACDKVIDKAAQIAAHQLEASADDLEYAGGAFTVKGSPDKTMPLAAIAFEAFTAHNLPDGLEPNLEAHVTYDPPNFSWPFGTHMCVVEVDTETGGVDVLQYVAVDDCGVQINPLIVDGQVHGGVVQGMAQALFEEAVYDSDGNLKTSTLAEYLVPAASDVPAITLGHTVTPSPTNQLGVKGIGEAGTIGAAPAVINAIVDALSGLGVRDVPMPASPLNVWNAIHGAAVPPTPPAPTSATTRASPPEPPSRKREARHDPRRVRLRPGRLGRGGDQPARRARRRRQVPRRRAQPAAADEAAPGPAERARRHRPAARPVVHPRRRRPHRHRRADPAHGHRDAPTCWPSTSRCWPTPPSHVGDPQVRHRGTIGGSIAHADPASDLPATTLALGATYVAQGPSGTREIAAADFYESFLTSTLAPDELLTEIRVPKMQGAGWGFQKFNRRAQDWAIVGVAAWRRNGDAGVGLVNMGSTPILATSVASALAGGASIDDAAEQAAAEADPQADLNASVEYRVHLAKVLTRRALEAASS